MASEATPNQVSVPPSRNDPESVGADLNQELHRRQLDVEISRPIYTQPDFDTALQYEIPEPPTCRKRIQKLRSTCECSASRAKSAVNRMFPFLRIMKKYRIKRDFLGDLIAGLTVGIMHIPHGMAYGLLANTSPVHGLYVSFFAPLIYFFFGTSRHIAMGTMSVVSMMVGSAVDKGGCLEETVAIETTTISPTLAENVTDMSLTSGVETTDSLMCRVQVATAVALMVGIMQIAMALLKFGFVTTYLSSPLTRGFTTAAAIHVLTSQLKYLTGIPADRYTGAFKLIKTWIDNFKHIAEINWASIITSAICIIILILVKELVNPRVKEKIKMPVPIELILIILATVVSHFADLGNKYGMRVVGKIPRGIPAPELPDFSRMPDVAADAFSIAVVAFAINLSLAKLFAKKHVYDIDSNQELFSYGITNVLGSMFHCFTSTAALSRSSVQDALGGKTQVVSLISCTFLLVILYGVGTLVENLPIAVLSCTVIVNLKGMFLQFKDVPHLWKISKLDSLIWLVVMLATVILDVDLGLLAGVVFSLMTVVYRTQSPKSHMLGQAADSEMYRDLNTYKKCQGNSTLKVFQFQASLYYANCEFFINKLFKQSTVNPRDLKRSRQKAAKRTKLKIETQRPGSENGQDPEIDEDNNEMETDQTTVDNGAVPPTVTQIVSPVPLPESTVATIIIDCSLMGYVDCMGVSTLEQVIDEYKEVDVEILLSGCHDGVRETLEAADFFKKISRETIFPTVHDAVLFASCITEPGCGSDVSLRV